MSSGSTVDIPDRSGVLTKDPVIRSITLAGQLAGYRGAFLYDPVITEAHLEGASHSSQTGLDEVGGHSWFV